MPFKDGKHLCSCEICDCGRHKCACRPVIDVPMADSTTYGNAYVPYNCEKVKSCKPPPHMLQTDKPLSDQTTNRVDYVPHDAETPYRHKAAPYVAPEGDMENTTMYRNEFTDKKIERRQPFRHDTRRKNPGKFEGENTYSVDYRAWDIPKREPLNKRVYVPPADPFKGLPTYRSDYIPHEINKVKSCKPVEPLKSSAPLADMTDYRQCYVKHPIPPKFVRDPRVWTGPEQPFETLTTFQRDFTPKEGGRLPSCKPKHTFMESGKPLESGTTHRVDYVDHDMPKPPRHNPDPYVPVEGEIDLTTTYNKDFPTHPYCKTDPFKPKMAKRNVNPFDDRTENKENFKHWEAARRESMKPKHTFVLPEVPFAGLSTQRAHYIQHENSRVKSFKPTGSMLNSTKPLESDTNYRIEYCPKKLDPCPAALLNSKSSNYNFIEKDACGHSYFEPLPGVTPAKDPRRRVKT